MEVIKANNISCILSVFPATSKGQNMSTASPTNNCPYLNITWPYEKVTIYGMVTVYYNNVKY